MELVYLICQLWLDNRTAVSWWQLYKRARERTRRACFTSLPITRCNDVRDSENLNWIPLQMGTGREFTRPWSQRCLAFVFFFWRHQTFSELLRRHQQQLARHVVLPQVWCDPPLAGNTLRLYYSVRHLLKAHLIDFSPTSRHSDSNMFVIESVNSAIDW